MKTVRVCKSCGGKFEWVPRFRRPPEYCKKCRSGANIDRSIAVQSMARRLPNGKYIVMSCEYDGMVGNMLNKTTLTHSARDGFWPEGMLVFNVDTRQVYKIVGKEYTTQKIVPISDPPETVKKRINSSFPK